jgi:hypothetical protein
MNPNIPLVGVMLILFFSCHVVGEDRESTSSEEVRQLCNQVSLRDTFVMEGYAFDTLQFNRNSLPTGSSEGYKIITILDGECSFCTAKLNDWESFIHTFDKFPVYALAIGHSKEVVTFRVKKSDYQHTVLFSSNQSLSRFTSLGNSIHCSTFLLDRENIVRLIGNPTQDENILNEYHQFHQKVLEK